jgi:protein AbiQ
MAIQISFLSNKFFSLYPEDKFPEIERKRNRPYLVIVIMTSIGKFAIPLRHHIGHNYAFFTDFAGRCGLDFTKTIVVSNDDFIYNPPTPIMIDPAG